MLVRLEPRLETSRAMRLASPLIAAGLTVLAAVILFSALGRDPASALYVFFVRPLSSAYGLGEWAIKATPLALCALGLTIGFRGNVWNIGAEGQLTMGAICGGGVALAFHGEAGWWTLPLMLAAGALGGMAWGAIPALLRTRFNANEILTSLMLGYVALHLLGYLVHGPWRSPEGFNFPETRLFDEAALMPVLLSGTRLHAGVILALVAFAAVWLFTARSFRGFKVDVAGQAPAAAAYAGFARSGVVWLSFLVSGGLAGLAGIVEVTGTIGQLQPVISPGYGFAAIIVAFLGRLHPVGVVIASLLMSLVYLGGESLQINQNLPLAVTGVFQGLLLFFVLGTDVLVRYRIRIARLAGEEA
ncbi:ABC transporter permease [Kaustia mangrovi]|uniref:ABC transporter permease n=1 Tax=Kaustia mangrovi TaxID=2593653 RepID=A0A7S8C7L8_9HYPH|nr:ABC transporter permease [Kaustia mangrovi]QPC44827.1 ABC transporter permease [Kaustia mangrovi]